MISVSIITIAVNCRPFARRTIISLLAQTHAFEWVVVDGGSHDGTAEELRQSIRSGDKMISEPDRGIADAFNKAIRMATGDVLLFMNAGDEFASPTALADLIASWDGGHRWITASAEVCTEDGRVLYTRIRDTAADPLRLVRLGCRIFHQATAVERSLFAEHGDFNAAYRTSMDYELWLRWIEAGHLPQVVNNVVCRFRVGGASSAVLRRLHEERRARAAHGFSLGRWQETRLSAIALLKHGLRGIAGPLAYKCKEFLSW
jgi:glycosyltransferase